MDLMSGMFRGVCVDNRDPRNLGRIRVQVPQILGVAASGWAFPAWSLSETTVWPQDRLPQPNQGVWVMFDSTSPDKIIWLAAFGPLPLINQPEYVEDPAYQSTLTLVMSNNPTWNQVTTFSGVLGSDVGGVPNPNASVILSGRQVGKDWSALETVVPNPATGAWSVGHLVQLTGQVEYRATFTGAGVYGSAASDTIAASTPAVTYPTVLTLAMTDPAPALNKRVPFSGTLTTGGSPPPGYTVPHPSAGVALLAKPSGGAWAPVMTDIAVDPVTGAWTTDYLLSIPGSVQYQATFPGLGIYLASQSSIVTVSTSVGVTVSTPAVPALTYGSGFNVSGTVKVTSTGALVTAGTVELWWRHTAGADQTWKSSGVSQTVTAGAYSLTHPSLAVLGATEWQVKFLGSSTFDPANSAVAAATVTLPAMGALTKGAITSTTAAFSWAAVPGATGYEVIRRVSGGAWGAPTTTAALSFSATSLAADTTYEWEVRATATNNASVAVYSTYSPIVSMSTGHVAVIVSAGSTATFSIDTNTFRCHRNDSTGWGDSGDYEMRQGYFSSLYGGYGYIGIAKFSGSTIKDAVVTACGTDGTLKQANGTCSLAQITLYRTTTGVDTNATLKFYTTLSTGTGGRPDLDGTAVSIAASGYSTSKTYNIGTAHGQRLGDAGANSVAISSNSSGQYAGLNGSGTNGGKLELKWTWPDITKTAAVAAKWL